MIHFMNFLWTQKQGMQFNNGGERWNKMMVNPFKNYILNETWHASFTEVSGMETLPTDSLFIHFTFFREYTTFSYHLHFYQGILLPQQPLNLHIKAAQAFRAGVTLTWDIQRRTRSTSLESAGPFKTWERSWRCCMYQRTDTDYYNTDTSNIST